MGSNTAARPNEPIVRSPTATASAGKAAQRLQKRLRARGPILIPEGYFNKLLVVEFNQATGGRTGSYFLLPLAA